MTVEFESALRGQFQSAELVVGEDEAAAAVSAARAVVAKRDARRMRYLQGTGIAAVAVLVAGTVLVGTHLARPGSRTVSPGASSGLEHTSVAVRDWPARGDRLADSSLIARARATAKITGANTRVLYAGSLNDQTFVAAVVFVTSETHSDSVAFVTQYSATSALKLSGKTSIPAGSSKSYVGFVDAPRITAAVATTAAIQSGNIHNLSTLAGMLEGPDTEPAGIVSSLYDGRESDSPDSTRGLTSGFFSTSLMPESSVWNTYAADNQGKLLAGGQLAATNGTNPVEPRLTKNAGELTVPSSQIPKKSDVRSSSLVGTPLGLIGTLTATGTVNTDLTLASQACTFITLQTAYQGTIHRGPDGKYTFTPDSSSTELGLGRLACRVTMPDGSFVYLNLGRVGDPPLASNQIAYTQPDTAAGTYLLAPSA